MDKTFTIECVLPIEHNQTKWSGYFSPVWWDDRWRVGLTSKYRTATLYLDLSRRDKSSNEPVIADCTVSVICDDKFVKNECAFKKMFVSGSRVKMCDIPIGPPLHFESIPDPQLVPQERPASLHQLIAKIEELHGRYSLKKFLQIAVKIVYRSDSSLFKGYQCSSSASLKDDIESYTASPAGLECADVELIGSDGSVYTHSFLLKSRSYIMMTLIEYHTIDGHESVRIKFPTVPKDVLEDLVSFIERDTVPNLSENAMDLFILADQYYLRKLKSICENYLANGVNEENAQQLQILCDTIGSPLISAALDRVQGALSVSQLL